MSLIRAVQGVDLGICKAALTERARYIHARACERCASHWSMRQDKAKISILIAVSSSTACMVGFSLGGIGEPGEKKPSVSRNH